MSGPDWERLDSSCARPSARQAPSGLVYEGNTYCGNCRKLRRLSAWAVSWVAFVLVFNALSAGLDGRIGWAIFSGCLAGLGMSVAIRAWRTVRRAERRGV